MDSQDKLLELINNLNDPPKTLTPTNVKFVGIESTGGNGAKLILDSVPGRGYIGQAELTYTRLNLAEILAGATVRSPDDLSPEGFLGMLNAAYNLFLSTIDLELIEIPPLNEGETAQIQLTTVPDSYGFYGAVSIKLEFGKSWLDQVVANKNLNRLRHPITVQYKQSARMLTWSKDFTSVRDALKLDKSGNYTDWDALVKACAFMGIPSWLQRTAVDQPTSAVADANPLFDRVVIQSVVYSDGMEGALYFHYNVLEEI